MFVSKINLLCLLFALPAFALDVQQGTITAATSKNNRTTAVPFEVPIGPVSVQCDADAYVYIGGDSSAAASSGVSVKVFQDVLYETSTTPNRTVIAVLPVSGVVNCKVFQVIGMAKGGRRSGSSPMPCGVNDSCSAVEYFATINDGTEGYTCGAVGWCVDPGPGTGNSIGTDSNGDLLLGNGTRIVWVGSTKIESGQVTVTNGAVNVNNSLIRDNATGYLQIASRFEIQMQTLGPCPRVNGTLPLVLQSGTGGTSGTASKLCACISDGAGNYVWHNLISGNDGDNTTCPA